MLLINLFVAFVIQAYTQAYKDIKSYPTMADYDCLTTLWSEYDPLATFLIDPSDIPFLVHELPGKLGRTDYYEEILAEIRRTTE